MLPARRSLSSLCAVLCTCCSVFAGSTGAENPWAGTESVRVWEFRTLSPGAGHSHSPLFATRHHVHVKDMTRNGWVFFGLKTSDGGVSYGEVFANATMLHASGIPLGGPGYGPRSSQTGSTNAGDPSSLHATRIFPDDFADILEDEKEWFAAIEVMNTQDMAIIWNPISFSPSSGCLGSACGASGCLGSGCVGSGCLGSACTGSGCGGSGCSGSVCGGSGCVGSVCGGSGCAGSVCNGSGCLGSACVGSLCLGSGCVGSVCFGSGCGVSICGGSGCGQSLCVGSSCGISACYGSNCLVSACVDSGCNGQQCAVVSPVGNRESIIASKDDHPHNRPLVPVNELPLWSPHSASARAVLTIVMADDASTAPLVESGAHGSEISVL